MDRTEQSSFCGKRVETVLLNEIPTIQDQTLIVFKAIESGIDPVFYTPDPDNPKEGFHVTLPNMLQATYKCKACNTVVVRRILKADILRGNVAIVLDCIECNRQSQVINIGPECDTIVFFSAIKEGKTKQSLEDFF